MERGVLNFSTSFDVADFMVAQDSGSSQRVLDYSQREFRKLVQTLWNRCVCKEKESRPPIFFSLFY